MKARTRSPRVSADSAIDAYLESLGAYPTLSRDDEVALAARARAGDDGAVNALVCANLRFVVSIARRFQHLGVPLADLISEGNLGLLRATRRYDERRGFKLISYAVWWIRQGILQALSEQGRVVRVPAGQAGALYRVSRSTNTLTQLLGREPTIDEIAGELGVPASEIEWTLSSLRTATSLQSPVGDDGDLSLADVLCDDRAPVPDTGLARDDEAGEARKALDSLSEREAHVLSAYFGFYGEEMTLESIGHSMGIGRERVRQIRDRAIRRLRE